MIVYEENSWGLEEVDIPVGWQMDFLSRSPDLDERQVSRISTFLVMPCTTLYDASRPSVSQQICGGKCVGLNGESGVGESGGEMVEPGIPSSFGSPPDWK